MAKDGEGGKFMEKIRRRSGYVIICDQLTLCLYEYVMYIDYIDIVKQYLCI